MNQTSFFSTWQFRAGVVTAITLIVGSTTFILGSRYQNAKKHEAQIKVEEQKQVELKEQAKTPSLKTALLEHVPFDTPTAKVTYNYKDNAVLITYCGDYQKVLTDFKAALKEKKLGDYIVNEDEIFFTNTGECVQ